MRRFFGSISRQRRRKARQEDNDATDIQVAPGDSNAPRSNLKEFSVITSQILNDYPVTPDIKILPDEPIDGGVSLLYKGVYTRGPKKGEYVSMKCPKGRFSEFRDDYETFRREILPWRNMRHANILPFYGTFVHEEHIYMVSAWADNGSLMAYLQHEDGKANREGLLAQIANALSYIHETIDIVHGDVKSSNVFISSRGDALLADSVLVTYLQAFQPSATQTTASFVTPSTIRYTAPEMIMAASQDQDVVTSRAADVYAFGMLILEVYTMERPWGDLYQGAVAMQVMLGRKPPKPEGEAVSRGFTSRLWTLVEKCLEHDPANRPTMSRLAELIQSDSVPAVATDLSDEVSLERPEDLESGARQVGIWRKEGKNQNVFLKRLKYPHLPQKVVQHEIQGLSLIAHVHILSVYGTAHVGSQLVIVSSWTETVDIMTYIRKNQSSQANRFRLLHQISNALWHLHSSYVATTGPIAHGLLHPDNVLVTTSGDVKLTDFGLSSLSNIQADGFEPPDHPNASVLDVEWSNMFDNVEMPVRFLPPEFFINKDHQPNMQGDVYSFAMVMLQILTGNEPFKDVSDPLSVILRVTQGRVPERPQVPETVIDDLTWKLITHCWSYRPEDRPRMDEVQDRLATFLP